MRIWLCCELGIPTCSDEQVRRFRLDSGSHKKSENGVLSIMNAMPERTPERASQRKPDRKPAPAPSFGKTQQLLTELPAMLQQMQEQSIGLQKSIKWQVNQMSKQSTLAESQYELTNRVYDRIDALTAETRVTNVLLAELVAIHKSVVSDTNNAERERVRQDAYATVLNGQ